MKDIFRYEVESRRTSSSSHDYALYDIQIVFARLTPAQEGKFFMITFQGTSTWVEGSRSCGSRELDTGHFSLVSGYYSPTVMLKNLAVRGKRDS